MGNDLAQRLELALYFASDALSFHLIGRQAQAYRTRIGQVSQFQVRGQGVFPCFDPLGEHRLGESGGNHRAVDDLPQREMGLQAGHHLVFDQVFHFEGYARQRDDHVPVAFEPHARGCAVGVEQDRAACGNHCLRAVELVEPDAALGEHFLDVLRYPLVIAHFAVEHLCEGLLGDVVLRGAEASRDDGHLRAREGVFHGLDNLCPVVADRDFLADHDAGRIEVFGNGNRIGIHDLSDEYFIADGDDCRFHGRMVTDFPQVPAAFAECWRLRGVLSRRFSELLLFLRSPRPAGLPRRRSARGTPL